MALAVSVATTLVVATAATGLLPILHSDDPAVADVRSSAFATAALAIVTPPEAAAATAAEAGADPDDVDLGRAGVGPDALPANSGAGRRVVFSQSAQRVWLVEATGSISRSYLVSGSRHDNLRPGTYSVFTRLRHTTAYDYESQLAYFVGFARGRNAVIGFHDIPVANDGKLLQTTAELGVPLSSGCIRQSRPDAIGLWNFASMGAEVVVVA